MASKYQASSFRDLERPSTSEVEILNTRDGPMHSSVPRNSAIIEDESTCISIKEMTSISSIPGPETRPTTAATEQKNRATVSNYLHWKMVAHEKKMKRRNMLKAGSASAPAGCSEPSPTAKSNSTSPVPPSRAAPASTKSTASMFKNAILSVLQMRTPSKMSPNKTPQHGKEPNNPTSAGLPSQHSPRTCSPKLSSKSNLMQAWGDGPPSSTGPMHRSQPATPSRHREMMAEFHSVPRDARFSGHEDLESESLVVSTSARNHIRGGVGSDTVIPPLGNVGGVAEQNLPSDLKEDRHEADDPFAEYRQDPLDESIIISIRPPAKDTIQSIKAQDLRQPNSPALIDHDFQTPQELWRVDDLLEEDIDL